MKRLIQSSSLIWVSVFLYFCIVEVIILICNPELFLSPQIILNRAMFLGVFLLSYVLRQWLSSKHWVLATVVLIYACLSVLYKETALLNQLFYPEIDAKLIAFDEFLFGFQPSLEFSKHFHSFIFSELMYFGYFSYYLMPLVILSILYKKAPEKIQEFGFMLISSFLLYYVVFIVLPALGPQFYLPYPENYVEAQGLFGYIIKDIQKNGEARTAAFPSSHVGVALIMLIWVYFNLKKYLKYFIPTVILLILATVYLKAHYVVDVLAGFVTAPLVYLINQQFFKKISQSHVDSN